MWPLLPGGESFERQSLRKASASYMGLCVATTIHGCFQRLALAAASWLWNHLYCGEPSV